jgi:RHS repeat-associated protein
VYDQGGAAANANDRLTTMSDGVGSEAYQYDILGRTTKLTKTIGGTAFPITYAYNYASELTSITYPSNRQVQQTFDPIGRLSQIQSGGTNYLSNIQYNSASEPTSLNYGNGVQAGFSYNAQLQLQSLAYTKGASTLFSLNYDYTTGVPGDNGQIEKITDNVDSTKTTTYTYDAWLRLKSASNTQWTVTETYDRFGNRKSQSAPVLNNVTPSTSTNRLTDSGYAYDAAGNMTADGQNTMVYDGENRVASAINGGASGAYTYDGNGLRVTKCVPNCTSPTTTTVYIFSGSKVIAEYDNGAAVSSPSREYIYSGAQLLATISGSSTTYHHTDHFSERIATDQNGNVARNYGHYPFGETWYETGTASKLKFTSYERDSESGNDYAMMRYDVNRLGRFSSPDPIGGSLADPQSLNRYAYVENDPTNGADPLGLYCYVGQIGCHQGGAWAAFGIGFIQVFSNEGTFSIYWLPVGQTGGGGDPQQKQEKEREKKKKKKPDCFAELKYNSNPARYGAPAGATHSFWYVQNSQGNQYIVSAGPTRTGAGGDWGALNVYGPNTPVNDSTKNSGANKASDTTQWQTGPSPDDCDKVDKLLAAARAFPNNSIPYNAIYGPNSNSAAALLGNAAGFSVTAPPPGAWGWGARIGP